MTVHTVTTPLRPDEIVTRRGIQITAPVRTLLDVAQAGTAPDWAGTVTDGFGS